MSNKRVNESEIEKITDQLVQLEINYENNQKNLLKKRNKLIAQKSSNKKSKSFHKLVSIKAYFHFDIC